MTPEDLSRVIELALLRVSDRWCASNQILDKRRIGEALREVANEIDGMMLGKRNAG